jgi:hypothetical protein
MDNESEVINRSSTFGFFLGTRFNRSSTAGYLQLCPAITWALLVLFCAELPLLIVFVHKEVERVGSARPSMADLIRPLNRCSRQEHYAALQLSVGVGACTLGCLCAIHVLLALVQRDGYHLRACQGSSALVAAATLLLAVRTRAAAPLTAMAACIVRIVHSSILML